MNLCIGFDIGYTFDKEQYYIFIVYTYFMLLYCFLHQNLKDARSVSLYPYRSNRSQIFQYVKGARTQKIGLKILKYDLGKSLSKEMCCK